MSKEIEAMHTDIREIKSHTIELLKQVAINTTVLIEHERRSTQLEGRVDPLEKDYVFRHKLSTLVLGSGGILAIAAAVIIRLLSGRV